MGLPTSWEIWQWSRSSTAPTPRCQNPKLSGLGHNPPPHSWFGARLCPPLPAGPSPRAAVLRPAHAPFFSTLLQSWATSPSLYLARLELGYTTFLPWVPGLWLGRISSSLWGQVGLSQAPFLHSWLRNRLFPSPLGMAGCNPTAPAFIKKANWSEIKYFCWLCPLRWWFPSN